VVHVDGGGHLVAVLIRAHRLACTGNGGRRSEKRRLVVVSRVKFPRERLVELARRLDVKVRSAVDALKRAVKSEEGDLGEVIKIGAAVVIIALLVAFGKDIYKWIVDTWEEIKSK
jgi:hypothetical protein